jgi:hypothetical protein
MIIKYIVIGSKEKHLLCTAYIKQEDIDNCETKAEKKLLVDQRIQEHFDKNIMPEYFNPFEE